MATEELNNTNSIQKEFQSLLDQDFKDRKLKENEIIKATVTEITKNFIVVDCKAKMEGMIPIEEFKNDDELSNLKIGSTIDVFLERIESARSGEIVLSRDKARKMKSWKKMEKVFETQEELTGYITGKVKGGFICTVDSLACFMPSSQIDVRPLKRVDHLMNTPVKVIATRIDKNRGNVCVSRRAVLEKSKSAEVAEALKNIKEGDVVESIVHAVVEWGIFLTYKGVTLLLHVSDLSHGRVKKPSDLVTIGQKLKVKITKIDPKTNRVSASVKALTEDPYSNIEKNYKIGEIYEGTVTKLMDYGAFVRISEGIEGLIHSSELDWTNRNIKPSKVLSVSESIKFKIVNIDKDTKRISLSYKATLKNPWEKIKDKLGKEVKIKINNITDKEIFAELVESGLSGMLHYKEISYEENLDDLKKYKKNDILSVKILEIKDDKIRFSKRALGNDPLNWFEENNKKIGDIITTRIHEVLKMGVKVSIDKEKKLIVTIRKIDLAKEAADARPEVFAPGNALDAKITDLDLKNRRIKLSVKAAQIDEEKSLIEKFGEGATKSGATLKGIFEKAIGKKPKKEK
jgi:small subunit ribosomal protein S1